MTKGFTSLSDWLQDWVSLGTLMTATKTQTQDDYAWADYLIYMEAGAELPYSLDAAAMAKPKPEVWKGAAFAALLAAVAYVAVAWLPKGLEPVSVVLPLGLVIGNLFTIPEALRPGIRYSLRTVLMIGIILLGARLNFADVMATGAEALVLSAAQVVVLLGLAFVIRHALKLAPKQATLLGIGTAICGGSAIIATAPVIDAEERDVAFSVATVSILGLLVMFLLPPIGHALNMDPQTFGIWAGLAIHQTPQVVAAGFAYHPDAGQAATVVKLSRVTLLAPVVLVLSLIYRKAAGRKRKKLTISDFLPPMVVGFLSLAILHSVGLIPTLQIQFPRWQALPVNLLDLMKTVSGFAIAAGMAALGLETSLRSLKNVGLRPAIAGVLLAAASVVFSFAAIRLL